MDSDSVEVLQLEIFHVLYTIYALAVCSTDVKPLLTHEYPFTTLPHERNTVHV